MLVQISHERSQALLRQRNLFALTSAGLAVALVVAGGFPDQPQDPNQFICDGDVYCIDGSCETIQRQANDEFKDAVVALNAMDQARREFDPDSLTLFKGTRETCSSKVFGILNCCKGKGFPLIPGIQLLVALGCSREEMLLHEKDVQGLCAYVGTYCSSSFLGVCLTKRKVYCCFESKLSRILQEQGRLQLNKPWGRPKTEQCLGFPSVTGCSTFSHRAAAPAK